MHAQSGEECHVADLDDVHALDPQRAVGQDVDPGTGIVYLTEDDSRLPIPADPATETPEESRTSFLYRYLPEDPRPRPGALQQGGRLQALAIDKRPSYNLDLGKTGDRFAVVWKDVRPEQAHEDALAKGCARFNRLEGSFFSAGAFWFDDTAGGEARSRERADGADRDRELARHL